MRTDYYNDKDEIVWSHQHKNGLAFVDAVDIAKDIVKRLDVAKAVVVARDKTKVVTKEQS